MKFIELKDLNIRDKLIVAVKKDSEYCPYIVKVVKDTYWIYFQNLNFKSINLDIKNFFHLYKGVDINKQKVYEIGVFDSIEECQKWCDFENEIRKL